MTIKEYRDLKILSQSSLKLLDYSPKKFYNYEYKWLNGEGERTDPPMNDSMKFGSLVDCLLFTPEEFKTVFAINNAAQPTGQMLTFTDYFYQIEKEFKSTITGEILPEQVEVLLSRAYEYAEFKRDSKDKVLERFTKEGLEYYKFLRQSEGKITISKEMFDDANKLVQELNADEFTGKILNASGPTIEMFKQLPIVVEGNSIIPVKGLLDLVIVNHETKSIHPYDLKTTGEANFMTSYLSRRYDLQGALYTHLLYLWRQTNNFTEYQIQPFTFIVGYSNGNSPEIYEMSKEQLKLGTYGGINAYNKTVKGYTQLLGDFKWHKENNKWKYPKEVYLNNGIKVIT